MVVDSAICVFTTGTRTWVDTLVVATSKVVGAVIVDGALMSAGRWSSEESWLTTADCKTVDVFANRVGTTFVGLAGIPDFFTDLTGWLQIAADVRITIIPWEADTFGPVILHLAMSVWSTSGSVTRVAAVIINTGKTVSAIGVDYTNRPAVGRGADVSSKT